MSATTAQRDRLRRMINEPTTDTYSNDDLDEYIEAYAMTDAELNATDSAEWTPTYDLNAAAADIWLEKAAELQPSFDHEDIESAGSGSEIQYFATTQNEQQPYNNAMRMHRRYAARRVARSRRLGVSDEESTLLHQ